MKKIINIIIIATLCLSLIGCAKDKEEKSEKVNNKSTNDISEKKSNESESKDKNVENNSTTSDPNTSEASSTATEVPTDNPQTSDTTNQINKEQAINILIAKDKQQLNLPMSINNYNINVTEDITIKNIPCYSLKAYNQTTNELEGLFAISKDGELIFRHNGHKYVKIK